MGVENDEDSAGGDQEDFTVECDEIDLSKTLDEAIGDLMAIPGADDLSDEVWLKVASRAANFTNSDSILSGNWTCRTYVFLLNFYFPYVSLQFLSVFSLLTYFYSFFPLSANYPRHSK